MPMMKMMTSMLSGLAIAALLTMMPGKREHGRA